jgi:protein-S-isoprenylcysteine O-methyltransferase Ste14
MEIGVSLRISDKEFVPKGSENMNSKNMTRLGVGLQFAYLSISWFLVTIIAHLYFYPFFRISIIHYRILLILGILLIMIGIPFYVMAGFTVMRAYDAGKLVTGGIYRLCRHPLYAAWVVLIVPGINLIINSWIGLSTPLFMYIVLRILVKREDMYLQERFGREYIEYKNRVPAILPIGLAMKR